MTENYVQSGFFFVTHFLRTWSCLFFTTADAVCFFSTVHVTFLLSIFRVGVSLLDCVVSNYPIPAFQFTLVGKRGLILFTLGAFGQHRSTTPLPVGPLSATMWKVTIMSHQLNNRLNFLEYFRLLLRSGWRGPQALVVQSFNCLQTVPKYRDIIITRLT